MKTYTMRQNATRAARQALGREAVENRDFKILCTEAPEPEAWSWMDIRTAADLGATETDTPAAAPQMPQDGQDVPAWEKGRETKGKAVLRLLQRQGGATNAEIMEATGWQTHTVRGFFAGKQLKNMGFTTHRFIRPASDVVAYEAISLAGAPTSADHQPEA